MLTGGFTMIHEERVNNVKQYLANVPLYHFDAGEIPLLCALFCSIIGPNAEQITELEKIVDKLKQQSTHSVKPSGFDDKFKGL